MSELTTNSKEFFRELARRKRALGIEEREWSIRVDTAALQSIQEYWSSFKKALGKERAVDYLIYLMCLGYEGLVIAKENRARKSQR